MKNPLESLPITIVMGLVLTVVMAFLVHAINGEPAAEAEMPAPVEQTTTPPAATDQPAADDQQ